MNILNSLLILIPYAKFFSIFFAAATKICICLGQWELWILLLLSKYKNSLVLPLSQTEQKFAFKFLIFT